MPYSRKHLRRLMSIADSIDGLLDSKERLEPDIKSCLENASRYVDMATCKMEVAGGDYAASRIPNLQMSLPFTIEGTTGEVLAEVGAKQEDN